MRNAELALHFDELADLYELDGAIVHRVLAYRNAAKAIREAGASVADMTRAGTVTELPGIGKTIEEKLTTLLDTGQIPSAEKLKAKYPPGLVEITRLPGLGPKRARKLFDEMGIASLDELKKAAEARAAAHPARVRPEGGGEHPACTRGRGGRPLQAEAAPVEGASDRRGAARRTPGASPRPSGWRSRAAPGGGPIRARTSTSSLPLRTHARSRTRSARCRSSPRPTRPARPALAGSRTTASASTCGSSRPRTSATCSST